MRTLIPLIVLLITSSAAAQPAPRVRITFQAQSDSFAASVAEYTRLWNAEGERIVQAMEAVSGLRFVYAQFADTTITANVLERASRSGYRTSPMEMRASYPLDTKRATLVHELGHRLMAGLFRRDEEEHPALFLWLYDTWIRLYGRAFADAQVAVEIERRGPYPEAWRQAMALDSAGRARRWREILNERLPTRR